MTKTLLMARFTVREALHKRVVHGILALTIAFVLVFTLGVWFAFHQLGTVQGGAQMATVHRMVALQFTMLGMNAVSGIGALLAIFLSVGTISSEIDAGTLHAIVPKPLTRRDILLGKWLGYAITIAVYVFVLSIVVGTIVGVLSGRLDAWQLFTASLPLVVQALLLLSLSVLGTTFLPTVANGVVVFGLYSVALMSGFVEQLGSLISNQSMIDIGIVVSLLVPSDSMAKLSASILQSGASYLERMGPFVVNSEPSGWMVVYTVVYILATLGVANLVFSRRDL